MDLWNKKKQALFWGACFLILPWLKAQPSLRLDTLDVRVCVVVSPPEQHNWNGGNGSIKVFVGERPPDRESAGSGMAGQSSWRGEEMVFRPAIPFRKGLQYWALLPEGQALPFKLPREALGPSPEVIAVYPSADTLPANQLKIYLVFNTPMSGGHAYQQVRLSRVGGGEVREPFVPLQPELWSGDRRRLTLWLDPGRVKRDLGPNEVEGEVLSEGGDYVLEILSGWPSTTGDTLALPARKAFHAGPADREKPDAEKWKISSPAAGSRAALLVHFNEPLDAVLGNTAIAVIKKGSQFPGNAELANDERVWKFVPDRNWAAGNYTLEVEPRLEDLASNNLQRVFDKDLLSSKEEEDRREVIMVGFVVE